MPRSVRLLLAFALVIAACGGPDSADTTSTTAATTSTTAAASTTAAPSTTTTTTTATTTTTTTIPAGELPAGAPSTWVGVTTDYEAVEVDAATGEVIRSLGQIATAEDVETAECAACINAIDAVWRTGDGSHFLISECCEPASGMIHVLADEDLPLLLGDDGERVFFWTAAPSDDSSQVAFLGYQLGVADLAADEGIDSSLTAVDLETLPVSNATWVPGEEAIRWLEGEADALQLRTYDVATGTSESVPVEGPTGWNSASLAVRAGGDLIVAPSDETTAAFLLAPDGTRQGDFGLEPGTRLGGYDASATFLIYVDADGVVHWMSEDGGGELASGFVQASW